MVTPPKRYDVTIPRTYTDAAGNQKTHFWQVGTAFPLRERSGFSIKLWSKLLVTDQLVVFEREPEDPEALPPPEDNIPF